MPRPPLLCLWGIGLGLGAGAICFAAAGASLGLFLGGLAAVSLIVPPLATKSLCSAAAVLGVAAVWLLGIPGGFHFTQWLAASAVLAGYGFALAASAMGLSRLIGSTLASALVTFLGLAWLTWPIWLAPAIAGQSLDWSVRLHPPLVINGVLANSVVWSEQPIAYSLMNLNQDATYDLPRSIWPCLAAHAGIAGLMLAIGYLVESRKIGVRISREKR